MKFDLPEPTGEVPLSKKDYLGDSVYVEEGIFAGEVILTTNNGYPDDPRNKIVMEPQVLQALLDWLRAKEIPDLTEQRKREKRDDGV